MKSNAFFGFIVAMISILAFQNNAHCIPTKWETVNISLSDLLKSGWQLSGIASNRVYQKNAFSPGGIDEETYTFSLVKQYSGQIYSDKVVVLDKKRLIA